MNALSKFENELEALIGRPTRLRPFVCDGSPLECGVFIVGFNPATEMADDFWKHWRPGYGFDKELWFEAYKDQRHARPLKPGKTRRTKVSNTRRVIEWIVEAASPIRCLETNIYSAATARAIDLTGGQRTTDPFSFLVKAIRPKIVVAHGKLAEIAVRKRFSDIQAHVIAVSHFSRGWSADKARCLGTQIKDGWGSSPLPPS
jgi:hypothetical protein